MTVEHFTIVGDTIGTQPWTQQRRVATASAAGGSYRYDTTGGGNKNDIVQQIQTYWVNDSPLTQWVYGQVTQGGTQVTLQARSRGYLAALHGQAVGADYSGVTLTAVSYTGIGADVGVGGLLAIGTGFATAEIRQNSTTIPLMPHVTGWTAVAPGQRFNAMVEVRFISEFWEATAIDGGDTGTESLFVVGDVRLDVFALPAYTLPGARPTPTVVAATSGRATSTGAVVAKPGGTTVGDVMVAIVGNLHGFNGITAPAGWTPQHSSLDKWFPENEEQLKIFVRVVAAAGEPASYHFGGSLLAEEIAAIVTIRDASTYFDEWAFASTRRTLDALRRTDTHVAPSISRSGQLLLAVSYFEHEWWQGVITHTPPTGMTELVDNGGTSSSLSVAVLTGPPNPTGARAFALSKDPQYFGHAVAATVLLPGTKVV